MSKKLCILELFIGPLILLVASLFVPRVAHAATFNVTNETELQDAIDTADTNNQDNTINLAAGLYTGSFTYDNSSGHALILNGDGQNNTFLTTSGGGADTLVVDTTGPLTVENMTFRGSGDDGILVEGSAGTNTNSFNLTIQHVKFYHNASYGMYVGFYNGDQGGSVTVTDSVFDGNGAGFSAEGGGLVVPFTFSRNTVINNTGHGLLLLRTVDGQDMVIDHNYFANNTNLWGAGFAAQADCHCKITATSNVIVNNTGNDGTAGVGVTLESNTSDAGGATMINFINNTVVHNTRADVNAGGLLANIDTPNSVSNFYNNVFWDNQAFEDDGLGADILLSLSSSPTVHFSHNDIHKLEVTGDTTNYFETNNFDTDPMFTGGGDATVYQTVVEGSKIVGTGTASAPAFPSTDFAGTIWRPNPDLGAYSLNVKYAPRTSSNAPDSCTPVPVGAPNLFQMNTSKNSATLFYTPANEASNYQISYGFNSSADQYRVVTNQGQTTGALSYVINSLPSSATMYFKVYGQNNCGQGQWSNTMAVKVQANKKYFRRL